MCDPHFTTGETGRRTTWSLYLGPDLLPQSQALHHPASKGVERGVGHRAGVNVLGSLQGWVTQALNTGLHLSPGCGW